jgi:hypothetical protein
MASIVGKALRGFGRALKRGKNLRSSKTGTIKFKPGVGGLKESRKTFEGLQKSSAEGVRKFGRPHTTKVISGTGVKKGFPGITKQAGDLERSRKKLGITKEQLSKGKK